MELVDVFIFLGILLALMALRWFLFGPPDDGDGGGWTPWG